MIARDYQRAAVAAAREKTASEGNTLLMLPVGSGKTCIAGFYIGEEAAIDPASRFLVVQHTDELIEQNCRTIGRITRLLIGRGRPATSPCPSECPPPLPITTSPRDRAKALNSRAMRSITRYVISGMTSAVPTSTRSQIGMPWKTGCREGSSRPEPSCPYDRP